MARPDRRRRPALWVLCSKQRYVWRGDPARARRRLRLPRTFKGCSAALSHCVGRARRCEQRQPLCTRAHRRQRRSAKHIRCAAACCPQPSLEHHHPDECLSVLGESARRGAEGGDAEHGLPESRGLSGGVCSASRERSCRWSRRTVNWAAGAAKGNALDAVFAARWWWGVPRSTLPTLAAS